MSTVSGRYDQDVLRAMRGDQTAYTRLIAGTAPLVSSLALSIVRDVDASEDVAQQVYIAVWRKLSALKNPASFLPWLRQSTRNAAYKYLRDNRTNRRLRGDESELLLEALEDTSPGPEASLRRQEQSALISKLISELPDASREVVLLYYREERETEHVAALLGLTPDNVRQRLARARKLLREEILDRYGKLLVLTVPSVATTAAVGAMLTASSPAAAAVGASIVAKQVSGLAKLAVWFGGAMIGAAGALLGVFMGFAPVLKRAPTERFRQELLRLRRNTVVCIAVSGLALTASYELTTGWWLPLVTYTMFFASLVYMSTRVMRIVGNKEFRDGSRGGPGRDRKNWGVLAAYAGLILGGVAGYGGLILGLINSGRL